MADSARIERLERELAAARKTVSALVARVERQADVDPDRFSILKAMAQLEEVIAARERDLARSEAWFRVLWDECPDMLVTLDREGHVQDRNRAARLAGLEEEFASAFEDHPGVRELMGQNLIDGELVLADGRPVHVHGVRLDGGMRLLVLRDLSVRRMLQEELNRTRRLAAVGQLAEAVAHEINNPLAVILGRLELLRSVEDPNPLELAHSLDVVQDHARRIGLISRNLHVFGRPGLGRQRHVRLSGLVERALGSGGRRMVDVQVDVSIEPPDLEVYGDPVQLEQVVVALLLNAADSMHRRGSIEVHARGTDRLRILEVRDQRSGLPEGFNERLQQPWSPADRPTRGLMLGMTVAAAVVRQHGGRLEALAGERKGCVIRVTLPRDDLVMGRLKVLVVDPRQDREELAGMLEGHDVRFVADGPGALEALEEQPDVILGTRYVAGLEGTLSAAVKRLHPELADRVVVLLSPQQSGATGDRVLRHPFSRLDLVEALDALIG